MSGRFGRIGLSMILGVILSSAPWLAGSVQARDADGERDATIMAILDQYLDALNEIDMEAHVSTYHFPHYRHASGEIVIWQSPLEAIPILKVPASERRARLREALEPEWHRSVWTRREIVQGDALKVHVVTRFDRLRADGSVIKSFDSLYVMTLQDGRWGIKGRSSFAP